MAGSPCPPPSGHLTSVSLSGKERHLLFMYLAAGSLRLIPCGFFWQMLPNPTPVCSFPLVSTAVKKSDFQSRFGRGFQCSLRFSSLGLSFRILLGSPESRGANYIPFNKVWLCRIFRVRVPLVLSLLLELYAHQNPLRFINRPFLKWDASSTTAAQGSLGKCAISVSPHEVLTLLSSLPVRNPRGFPVQG